MGETELQMRVRTGRKKAKKYQKYFLAFKPAYMLYIFQFGFIHMGKSKSNTLVDKFTPGQAQAFRILINLLQVITGQPDAA